MLMRRRLVEICVMAAFALIACSPKEGSGGPLAASNDPNAVQSPDGDAVSDAPVVVMLGDSLTAGYELPAGSALPAALQRLFDERSIPAKFVNAGVSGDTTADGLARYDWSVTGSHAALLLVALGANDFLNDMPADIPRSNLAAVLDRAKKDNLPAVLIGVQIPEGASDAGDREAEYAAIYPDLAAQYGVPYFPNMLGPIAGRPELLLQDGVHPTAEGVEAMAESLADFLAPLVDDLE